MIRDVSHGIKALKANLSAIVSNMGQKSPGEKRMFFYSVEAALNYNIRTASGRENRSLIHMTVTTWSFACTIAIKS